MEAEPKLTCQNKQTAHHELDMMQQTPAGTISSIALIDCLWILSSPGFKLIHIRGVVRQTTRHIISDCLSIWVAVIHGHGYYLKPMLVWFLGQIAIKPS
jgi:hypothetical protein